jgi:hypothetical protein
MKRITRSLWILYWLCLLFGALIGLIPSSENELEAIQQYGTLRPSWLPILNILTSVIMVFGIFFYAFNIKPVRVLSYKPANILLACFFCITEIMTIAFTCSEGNCSSDYKVQITAFTVVALLPAIYVFCRLSVLFDSKNKAIKG